MATPALAQTPPISDNRCAIELLVLGTAQDAGWPQIGDEDDPAWDDPALLGTASSLALIDRRNGNRFLFEATPDIRQQLHRLDGHAAPATPGIGLDGIFLTHAHIGHYLGLAMFGLEAANGRGIPVHTLPRLNRFLAENGPWSQLVEQGNIALMAMTEGEPVVIGDGISVTAWRVPHRDEFSETAAFVIRTPDKSALFLPDIDSWDRWESEFGMRIEDVIRDVDIAYIDASFYDDNEIPGRDMSLIPHPRIAAMIARFAPLGAGQYGKIRFIHLNRTNPVRFPESAERRAVEDAGFRVAGEGDADCLAAAEEN